MYYLNKIVGFIISPIGIAIALGIIAFICFKYNLKRIVKYLTAFVIVWMWIWMTPIMSCFIASPLEHEFLVSGRVPNVESFPNVDAIVLLGGSMGRDISLSDYAEMSTSADRVWQASRLLKAGKASKIIATGNDAKDSTIGILKDFGVDSKSVAFLDARNTEEEAKAVQELVIKSRGSENSGSDSTVSKPRILLVTSAWHMKRARMMFEKYAKNIEVVCAPSDFEMTILKRKSSDIRWILPDPYTFYLNSVAFHEWIGIIGYQLFR